jgi:hypothetical protein
MKKIIILNFETSEVHVFPYDENLYFDYEEFYVAALEDYGLDFKDSYCDCMIVDDLNIQIH